MAELLSPRALCTLEDVKAYLDPDDPSDDENDDLLRRLINAASNEIHKTSGNREFVAVNAVRDGAGVVTIAEQARVFDALTLRPTRSKHWQMRVGDLASLAAVSIDGVAVDVAKVTTLPRVREPWRPITRLRMPLDVDWHEQSLITITGVWGFPQIPEDIRQAAIVTVTIWAARDLQTFSDVFVAAEGRVEIPRSLPSQAFDVAIKYKRRRRAGTLQIGGS